MAIVDQSPLSPVADALRALAEAVDRVAALADPGAAPRVEGAEVASVVTGALALAGRLSAVAARAIPVVEADGWWSLEGARSITSWVAAHGRVSHGQAARLVGLGRALRDDLPTTALEVVAGAVSVEAAHVLATVASTPARKVALKASAQDCGEQFLVEHARALSVGQLRVLARRWASHADPEADERGYREATEREFLDLANTTDGWHLTGFLTSEHGHALTVALEAMSGRSADQAGQPAGRRRATALNNVVRTVLDRDLSGATGDHRPQVTVVTDLASLNRALGGAVPDRAMSQPVLRSAGAREVGSAVPDTRGASRSTTDVGGSAVVEPSGGASPPRLVSDVERSSVVEPSGASPPGLVSDVERSSVVEPSGGSSPPRWVSDGERSSVVEPSGGSSPP
ncbi:DUF222 domain-containing protein [Cellulomonas sp. URHD0024]|uniref:DUF222 domain-containing protein n=1 Tax=Cellulomonas sp. URHD0024 TaxID=1302620 RepID=UPI00040B6A0E|nr:DUF222 domain-containing protein [Cellulomonas sp. URHD0024]